MLAGQVRLTQVMDAWLVEAAVWEEHPEPLGRDYAHATYTMPLTEEEHAGDALSAVQSALSRWLRMTTA